MVKRPIFTKEHIDIWSRDLDDKPASATEAEWPDFPDVLAFRGQALSSGAIVRMRCRDGVVRDVRMNAVVARELAHWLFHAGQEAGWLDEKYEVISPLAELDG